MMTIKEISKRTGVSARALRYYDEIGLFSPTQKNEAGYRLYDENSLETLRQILYFKKLDMPLNLIKEIILNPALDKNHILKMQKKMLESKRAHIDRLISSIDSALKGEEMDFTVFTREESEELFEATLEHMPEEIKSAAITEFGSVEKWREHYLDTVGSEEIQRQYAKVVEWYGGKNNYANSVKNPLSIEIRESYLKRIEHILDNLSQKCDTDENSVEVRELIGEYGFVMKQLLQMKDEKDMMLMQAQFYREDKRIQKTTDEKYGDGFSVFISDVITKFYEQ